MQRISKYLPELKVRARRNGTILRELLSGDHPPV
jgi:hypothetical protein